jgi:hypothetical protein
MQQIQCIDAESRDQPLFSLRPVEGVETTRHKESRMPVKRFRKQRFSRSDFVEKFK